MMKDFDSPRRRPAHRLESSSAGRPSTKAHYRFTLKRGRRRRREAAETPVLGGGTALVNDGNRPKNELPEQEDPLSAHHGYDPVSGEGLATYIRPYTWTGGRTRATHQLELETLVSTSNLCHSTELQRLEHHSVADLCQYPRSVAEVGAILSVPLGVARVLLGDMADLGLLTVHRIDTESGTPHSILLERVLNGLHRL